MADPLASTARNPLGLGFRLVGGRSRIRRIITGTNAATVTWCSAIRESDASGSNVSGSTNVTPSALPSDSVSKPNEWNSGAGTYTTSLRRSGTVASSPAIAAGPLDRALRAAAFGVPVVPDVWMTIRPCRRGNTNGNSGAGGSRPMSSS